MTVKKAMDVIIITRPDCVLFQYPTWLSANKSKLETKEFANYSKQYEMMSAICVAFETEQSSDSDDAKKQRYEEILDLMEQMQNLGQPPKDIVQDMVSH